MPNLRIQQIMPNKALQPTLVPRAVDRWRWAFREVGAHVAWSRLSREHPTLQSVISRWEELVGQNPHEDVYHAYLKAHANLFLVDAVNSFFAVSKMKLGSEYELDFAVPEEAHGRGLIRELIEIEKPQHAPYTRNGNPSAALIRAKQQVRDWKRWLRTSRSEAQKLFSVWGIRREHDPNFRFTVVIGTRENTRRWLAERNQYAEENGSKR